MKIKEIILQEEQLNEFVWTPAATEGLVRLIGVEGAYWFTVAVVLGIPTVIGLGIGLISPPKQILKKVKDWVAGRKIKQEDIDELTKDIKKALTPGQRSWVTKLEKDVMKSIEQKDYRAVSSFVRELKNYLASTKKGEDMKINEILKQELVSEATPFRKVGKHKGYMMRSLSPAEQAAGERAVKAASKPKPPKPSKEEKQKALDEKLWKIYMIVNDAVGNSVPDGDPFDYVFPKVSKFLGIDKSAVRPWLDKAMKTQGYKNYDDYLVSMWDAYYEATAENAEEYAQMKKQNPWK